ncbi:MAG: protein glxC [Rhodospirillaceae bacterium]|nr:protein glxC [Rhodospirillaceae bacterium]MBT5040504.1 protein glxC [Rhodospirillaceae bacterium]
MRTIDLDTSSVRELNAGLHGAGAAPEEWQVLHPHGKHALAVGLEAAHKVSIDGHAGYYCGGMNKEADITVKGQCGKGLGENIMSGTIRVEGNAAEAVGASGHGGLIVIEGDASSRCGISMKGVDIVVKGSVGHMSGFMAQAGNLVVCGDADDDLGDSIYEARIYVRGKTGALGADCVEKEMTPEHVTALNQILKRAGMACGAAAFRRYGSARKLYNFDIDNAENY